MAPRRPAPALDPGAARSLGAPAAAGRTQPASSDVDLLHDLQRAAGNAAVASYLSGRRALQREPKDVKTPPTAEAQDLAAYNDTRKRHDHNRGVVQAWLKAGAAQKDDRRLRNSCEWANAGHTKLYIVTKTHDSRKRSADAGHPGGVAWFSFPAGEISASASYYTRRASPADAWDNTNIHFEDHDSTDGFGGGPTGVIGLMETALDQGAGHFYRILKHEVQHVADDHGTTEIERYKTEFRAFWMGSGEFNSVSPTDKEEHLGWTWNARQWAIFDNLYGDPVYGWLKTAWDAENGEPNRSKRGFQRAVVAFSLPASINPANSLRTDDFYQAVKATSPADCTADSPAQPNANVSAVRAELGKLDAADRHDIHLNRLFGDVLATHLRGTVLDEVRAALSK
jgi:hypothetical protein